MGADTKANTDSGGGGALELLEHAVPLDTACDDDGGRDAEPLVGEVDLLGRLCAPELVDLKSATINTAKREMCAGCQWALTPKRTLVGSGALELGDSRLFEDCTKRGGALVSDEVVPETASKGRRGAVREMSTGADTNANTIGRRRTRGG